MVALSSSTRSRCLRSARRARWLVAVLAAQAAASADAIGAQETFAVFVGINDYIEFGDEPGGDLLGAEADALRMKAVLTDRWDVREENTLLLLSRDATKSAIHDAITGWLAQRAGPGDLAIFYFAGHGAQVYDLDGDEPDALDETLAPADVQQLSSVNDIRDDEFRIWLSTVRTDIVVILDSCHSGTATRSGGMMRTRSLERPIPPEENEPEAVRQAFDGESMADGAGRVLELAAAAPNQSALEGPFGTNAKGEVESRGAFTHFLVEALTSAGPEVTYRDILEGVASELDYEELPQRPQLTGAGAFPLFKRPGDASR